MKGIVNPDMIDKLPQHFINKHGKREKVNLKLMEERAENYAFHPYLSKFYTDLEGLQQRVANRTRKKVYPKADMSLAVRGSSFQTKEVVDKILSKIEKNRALLKKRLDAQKPTKKRKTKPKKAPDQQPPATEVETKETSRDEGDLSPQQKAAITRKANREAKEALGKAPDQQPPATEE